MFCRCRCGFTLIVIYVCIFFHPILVLANDSKINVNNVNIDPQIASRLQLAWPLNDSFVPSNTTLGIQTVVSFEDGLPPVNVWLRFCISSYNTDDEYFAAAVNSVNNSRHTSNCSTFQNSKAQGFNVVVPKHIGKNLLVGHLKFCFLQNISKCLYTVSRPVIFEVYKSSGFAAFDDIFAGLSKVESSNAKSLEPISKQLIKDNGLSNEYELILLSPNKTITAFHQLMVKYAFVFKKNQTIAPPLPGEICISVISGPTQLTGTLVCAAVSASPFTSKDLTRNSGYKISNVTNSGYGRLLFVWGDDEIEDPGSSKSSSTTTKRWKQKVHPGLVYVMATFYYNKSKENAYAYGEPIDVVETKQADLTSPYGTFFFSNSFAYKSTFSFNIISQHILNQRSMEQTARILQTNINVKNKYYTKDADISKPLMQYSIKKKYVYMTIVWGDSFAHGVLALAASLRLVGSQFGLVVIIPRSSFDSSRRNVYMSPSTLAMLEGSLDIQDVLIFDDTGINDCFFGNKLKEQVLKDMICHPKLEEFAYMITNKLKPRRINIRVYLKLVAFGLTVYNSIGFIDADAIALNNPDASLLQPNNQFIGVGEGILPGAFFVLKPSLHEMENMMNILSATGARYRFAEMSFLNIYFGSTYNNNTANVHERFSEHYLCVVSDYSNLDYLTKTCKFIDFASCGIKPWEAIGIERPVRFHGHICPEVPVVGSAWNEAVNYWLQVYDKGVENTSLYRWKDINVGGFNEFETTEENEKILAITNPEENSQFASKNEELRITIAVDLKKLISTASMFSTICNILHAQEHYVLNVFVCLGRPCRSAKIDIKTFLQESLNVNQQAGINFCDEIGEYEQIKKTILMALPFPGIGQHAIKAFCFFPDAFKSNIIDDFGSSFNDQLRVLSRSNFSCGYDSILIEGLDNYVSFTDAQAYVSGGATFASDKWKFSGKGQFLTLRRMGLRPHHRVLEIGCGTFNLGRYLIPYLDVKNYVCVEPNEWLVVSSLDAMGFDNGSDGNTFNIITALKKKIQLLYRYDFNASSVVKSNADKFDFIYSHSVLSHASMSQLDSYIEISSQLLKLGGISLASMCLCAPCESMKRKDQYSKHGMKLDLMAQATSNIPCKESLDKVWIYPYVTWWSPGRLYRLGEKYNMRITWRNDIRENLMKYMASEAHDWIVMMKKTEKKNP
jgi:hypothetical protein